MGVKDTNEVRNKQILTPKPFGGIYLLVAYSGTISSIFLFDPNGGF